MDGKKLVFIDIDGINPDVFYKVLDDKHSNLHRIAGRGLRAEKAVTVFPAVTLCCQATMFTGAFPAKHGIMGNSWFDRFKQPAEFRYYTDAKTAAGNYGFALFGMPTIVLPEKEGLDYANRDMCPAVMTIYEAARKAGINSLQVFNQYSRGVDKKNWIRPSRPAMILFALCHEELVDNKHWDSSTFKHLYRGMRKNGADLPGIITFYISGHDNNSHENGPGDQLRYFSKVVDPLFGEMIAEFEKYAPLEEFNFLITSDHGQAQMIKKEEKIIYSEMLGEILGAVPGGGFHLAPRTETGPMHTAVANMEAGATQFHLINRATYKWPDPPRFEQDVLPAADALLAYKTGPMPFVDFLLVRPSAAEGYSVYDGDGLTSLETFFKGKDEKYPDAVRRLRGLNCDKSGDIIAILDYSSGYYFGDAPKAGEHGNLCSDDALIPFVVSGPGVPEKSVPFVSLIDAAPTAAAILGFDIPTADGKSVL